MAGEVQLPSGVEGRRRGGQDRAEDRPRPGNTGGGSELNTSASIGNLYDARIVVTSEREARSEFLLIYIHTLKI